MQIDPDVLPELAPTLLPPAAASHQARLADLRRRIALGRYVVDLDRLARCILERG